MQVIVIADKYWTACRLELASTLAASGLASKTTPGPLQNNSAPYSHSGWESKPTTPICDESRPFKINLVLEIFRKERRGESWGDRGEAGSKEVAWTLFKGCRMAKENLYLKQLQEKMIVHGRTGEDIPPLGVERA